MIISHKYDRPKKTKKCQLLRLSPQSDTCAWACDGWKENIQEAHVR